MGESPLIQSKPVIVVKKLSDLLPCPYNPRKIGFKEKEGLESSLKQFGLIEPLIYNKRNGTVLSGNQRFELLKKNGVEEASFVELDLDDVQEKALVLAMNNAGIQGTFTPAVQGILKELLELKPEVVESLNLGILESPLGVIEEFDPVPGLEIQPYEHYDYLLVMCSDLRDWYQLVDLFGIDRVNVSPVNKRKIGLGRGITYSSFRKKLDEWKAK